ncbi:hypothetical protein ABT294_44070 [Nonomuraea sp. NPDC000554]|uniref:hypothetical protein n=1 Tax=Nonomuraea sp. NPDC000554 TaxID=3154259 RepID=UPI003326F75B
MRRVRRCASRLDAPLAGSRIGRNRLVGELVRAGLEVADPVRDNGVDLLASAPHFTWTQPLG